jgi:ABC-type nitrate/sulfonate/bicarbonate transport system substrate-binding protein
MKKYFYILGAIAVIIAAYLVFAPEGDPKENRIRIAYNAQSITNAAIVLAYENGYFEKNGLSVEMIPLKGGKEVVQALVAGQADTGMAAFPNCMTVLERGAPIRYIAASVSSPNYIFVRPGELKTFTDLYGKLVSVGKNGIGDLTFRAAMEDENIDISRMEFTSIDREFIVAALMEKKVVDAMIVSEQDAETLKSAGAIVLEEWSDKGYDRDAYPRNAMAINTDFLNEHGKVSEKFIDSYIEAHRFIKNEPERAAQIIANHVRTVSGGAVLREPGDISSQWKSKTMENMVWQNPDITMQLAKQAWRMKLMERELQLSDVYDLRFQEKLEQAQREIYGN